MLRTLPVLLALAGCHAARPDPAQTTALAVDAVGLVVDVIAYVDSKSTSGPQRVVLVGADGGAVALCAPAPVGVAAMLADAG